MKTHELIESLAAGATPVRRLRAPWRRTALWLTISLPYLAAVVALQLVAGSDLLGRIDGRLVLEEIAIFTTAFTAGVAAFSSVVPRRDPRIALLPLLPLAVWFVSRGAGCLHDWLLSGESASQLRIDVNCFAAGLIFGPVPAATMILMLRRGASLVPGLTFALGALATAALVDFCLRLFHFGDISVAVTVWHFGAPIAISTLPGLLGVHVSLEGRA